MVRTKPRAREEEEEEEEEEEVRESSVDAWWEVRKPPLGPGRAVGRW